MSKPFLVQVFVWLLDLYGRCFGSYLTIALENEVFTALSRVILKIRAVVFISDLDCRCPKEELEEDGEMRVCSATVKNRYPMSKLFLLR